MESDDLVRTGQDQDTLSVYDQNSAIELPLGTVSLGRTDYARGVRIFSASSMSWSGNDIVITLGSQSAAASTATGAASMTWTPGASLADRAGNPLSARAVAEGGVADREF